MTDSVSGKKIWVAGHRGLLGNALLSRLRQDCADVVTVDRPILDLRNQKNVDAFLKQERPDIVIIVAGKVGGIAAHKAQPADFILDNLIICTNIIQSSLKYDIGTLVHVASSAVYPADAECPIKEEALLSGGLDPTHEAYAVANIAGIATNQAIRQQHGRNFFSVLPCNLYGPGANFDSTTSHFLPGLIRRAHEAKLANAKQLIAWGTGNRGAKCSMSMIAPMRSPSSWKTTLGLPPSISGPARITRSKRIWTRYVTWSDMAAVSRSIRPSRMASADA